MTLYIVMRCRFPVRKIYNENEINLFSSKYIMLDGHFCWNRWDCCVRRCLSPIGMCLSFVLTLHLEEQTQS